MNREELERAFSLPRFSRFVAAGGGDYRKGYDLYRVNLHVSSRLFATISLFEVVFRNAIDAHYKSFFPNDLEYGGWLLAQSYPNGFLSKRGCEKSRITLLESIQKLGEDYSHDKGVANLSFAFWRNLFNSKEFAAGGSSLLNIFPNKPHGYGLNQTFVFNELCLVHDLRNKIAHHDPICFIPQTAIFSLEKPAQSCKTMKNLLIWLGFDNTDLLDEITFDLK